MAGLTRAEIIRYAKADLDEEGDEFWTTSQLEDYADRANRMVFRELVKVAPTFFLVESGATTWLSGTVSDNVTTILGTDPYMILDIMETSSNAAIGPNNLPRMLTPMTFRERSMRYRSHWFDTGLSSSHSWSIQGDKVFLARIPQQNLILHYFYIAPMAKFTTGAGGDAEEVLDGRAEGWGDAVASCLAHLMNAKQEGENQMVSQKWMQAKADIVAMASRRRVGPKHVTITRNR
jgi:hypothetical protein